MYCELSVCEALYIRALYVLTNLILILILWGKYYDNPLFFLLFIYLFFDNPLFIVSQRLSILLKVTLLMGLGFLKTGILAPEHMLLTTSLDCNTAEFWMLRNNTNVVIYQIFENPGWKSSGIPVLIQSQPHEIREPCIGRKGDGIN